MGFDLKICLKLQNKRILGENKNNVQLGNYIYMQFSLIEIVLICIILFKICEMSIYYFVY